MPDARKPLRILLVEDDDGDALMIEREIAKSDPRVEILRAHDGGDAMALLDSGEVDPALILLDINMPGVDGHETLSRLRASARHSSTPVVVLTTSRAPRDIERAYAGRANAYVQKPSRLSELTNVVDTLRRFWAETAILPAHAVSY